MSPGGIVEILIIVAVIGLVAWLLIKLIPMPEPMPRVVIAVAVLLTLLLVLRSLGLIGYEVPVLDR